MKYVILAIYTAVSIFFGFCFGVASTEKQLDELRESHRIDIVEIAEAYEYLGQSRAYESIFSRQDVTWRKDK